MVSEIRPPRLERFGPSLMAGLWRTHRVGRDPESMFRDISGQWRAFREIWPDVPTPCYGAGLPMADGATALDYFCGAPVSERTPQGLERLTIPSLYCAVFQHTGPVVEVRQTLELVFGTVLPLAALEPADVIAGVPEFLERHGPSFNNQTGLGGLEILVPIKE